MKKATVRVDILTDEGWQDDIALTVDLWAGMDEVDINIEIAEAIVLWCSDNGYGYDDHCEYLDGYDATIDRLLDLANPEEHDPYTLHVPGVGIMGRVR